MNALDLRSRVTLPDGRAGGVVGTRTGTSSPRALQVRIDGTPAIGPHPWWLEKDLRAEQEQAA